MGGVQTVDITLWVSCEVESKVEMGSRMGWGSGVCVGGGKDAVYTPEDGVPALIQIEHDWASGVYHYIYIYIGIKEYAGRVCLTPA